MAGLPCPSCRKRELDLDGQHTYRSSSRELQMARSMCWHCQSEVSGEYFCDRCVKVQPVSKELDYFTCLGLPRRLTIDIGRASCRERVEISGVAVSLKKKK